MPQIHEYYQNPNETIRACKGDIKATAEHYHIPPDLLAAVLLAELDDYDVIDLLGDDWTLWGTEEHSIGITPLRIDNVRNWAIWLPEFGWGEGDDPAKNIRSALEDDKTAILLLAQAIQFRFPSKKICMCPLDQPSRKDETEWGHYQDPTFRLAKHRRIARTITGGIDWRVLTRRTKY
ncbi:hypothetical protein [Symmachiella macrocystis]|nr:hypothetical protein [Symmachiella macrocystis]